MSQGFHVLDPNYRGSTGFSLRYRESIKEDGWGGREQEDIRTGIEDLIAAGIAKAGRVGHHPLSTPDRCRFRTHLRYDRPGRGLGDDSPRPSPL